MRGLAHVVSELSQTPGASSTDSGPSVEPVLPLIRGMPVGRYLLLERLGGGGMGVVYAAFDPALDRTVALEFMRESVGAQRAHRIAEREAKAMARLSHPNVVGVFDVGTLSFATALTDALKAAPASRLQRRLTAIASRGCEAARASRYPSLCLLVAAPERALAARRTWRSPSRWPWSCRPSRSLRVSSSTP